MHVEEGDRRVRLEEKRMSNCRKRIKTSFQLMRDLETCKYLLHTHGKGRRWDVRGGERRRERERVVFFEKRHKRLFDDANPLDEENRTRRTRMGRWRDQEERRERREKESDGLGKQKCFSHDAKLTQKNSPASDTCNEGCGRKEDERGRMRKKSL
jgi:hypothetical protein